MVSEERLSLLQLYAWGWTPKQALSVDLTRWRKKLAIESVEVLYVIGIGDGAAYFSLAEWLGEDSKRRLVFLEQESGFIASLLAAKHPLFADGQVDVEWLFNLELLSQLAQRYPVMHIEISALPGYRREPYRTQLFHKTTLSAAVCHERRLGYQTFTNFARNLTNWKKSFYAHGLKNQFCGQTAIVCGAGPSLEKAIGFLKELSDRAIVIAAGSAVAPLAAAGIEPHFVLAIDPNKEESQRFQKAQKINCPVLTSTRVHYDIFEHCTGPIGHLRMGIGGVVELWMEEELGLCEPLFGLNLSMDSISVMPICLAFAVELGCSTVLLAGVDLAYTRDLRYADGVGVQELADAVTPNQNSDVIVRRKDKMGHVVATAVRWLIEKASLTYFVKRHRGVRWINTTEGGLSIPGFKQMELLEALRLYCTNSSNLKEKINRIIADHPMPDPQYKLEELKQSLDRMISHLEVLNDCKSGSKALAEFELKEEIASSILFYDIQTLLQQEPEENRWSFYLDLARKYKLAGQ